MEASPEHRFSEFLKGLPDSEWLDAPEFCFPPGINATGLLVILNESIVVLDPGLVAYRVCEYLNKKPRNIDYCLLVFESHEVCNNGIRRNQLLSIGACRTADHLADGYIDHLMQRWAEYNGAEYIRQQTNDPSAIAYRPKH